MPDEPGQPTSPQPGPVPPAAQPAAQPGGGPVHVGLPKTPLVSFVFLATFGLAALFLPVIHVYTSYINLYQAHGLCSSKLGVLGSALSSHIASDCQIVGVGVDSSLLAVAIGVLGIIAYVVHQARD